jgi:hypothetical protein
MLHAVREISKVTRNKLDLKHMHVKTRAQPDTCRTLDVIEVFSIMSAISIEIVNLTSLIPKEDLQKVTESCSQESKLG